MIYPRTFYIETYGCTFNQADSSKITKLLLDAKFLPTSQYHAEFIIINTCAVKSQTEAKILHRIESLSLESKQKLLITGCLPWISDKILGLLTEINPNLRVIFDPNSYSQLLTMLEKIDASNNIKIVRNPKDISKSAIQPWIHHTGDPGIVQISEGCNMSCTYCCTRVARGKAISFPLEQVLSQIRFYIENGTKEIFLTGQDCGFYQSETHDIIKLAEKIQDSFGNEDVFIRIGMIDPLNPIKIVELAQILHNSRIFYKFLHLPIQSASNKVLRSMRRGYTGEMIDHLFQELHKYKITLSTDIICGFPNETEEDFLQTYDFIKKHQPDIVNISKFTARPNTEAKNMTQLDSNLIKKRTKLLTQLYLQYTSQKNQLWKGWKGRVLIHAFQPNKPMNYSARSEFYKSVVLANGKMNTIVCAEIVDSTGQFLTGKIIDD